MRKLFLQVTWWKMLGFSVVGTFWLLEPVIVEWLTGKTCGKLSHDRVLYRCEKFFIVFIVLVVIEAGVFIESYYWFYFIFLKALTRSGCGGQKDKNASLPVFLFNCYKPRNWFSKLAPSASPKLLNLNHRMKVRR